MRTSDSALFHEIVIGRLSKSAEPGAPPDMRPHLSVSQRAAGGVSPLVEHAHDSDLLGMLHPSILHAIGPHQRTSEAVHVAGEEPAGIHGEEHPGMKFWSPEIMNSGERWRYHARTYDHVNGEIHVKRNHNAVKIGVYHGNPADPGSMREIVKYKIRDRRHDGTPHADMTPLTDWRYSGEADRGGRGAVELSTYTRDPQTFWAATHGDVEFGDYLKDPFKAMTAGYKDDHTDEEELAHLPLWRKAFENAALPLPQGRYPAQHAAPIRGAAQHFRDAAERIASRLGYKRFDNVPSWWNVVQYLEKNGHKYMYPEDATRVAEVRSAIDALDRGRIAAGHPPLTRAQESWVVFLQNMRQHLIPREFHLGGATMPLSPHRNLWMSKEI